MEASTFPYGPIAFSILPVSALFTRIFMMNTSLKNSSIYSGLVRHSRLKGGATHSLRYPIFLACIDLDEVDNIGSTLWPIFSINKGWFSFSSLDMWDHMKGHDIHNSSLSERVRTYIQMKTMAKEKPKGAIKLVTHLTYFGYCFNPVSFYYIFNEETPNVVDTILVEVSNTPWIEQHIYVLNESIGGIEFYREVKETGHQTITASWKKEFHVSPFMEMDYIYQFKFAMPTDSLSVYSKLIKESTNEVWFTASFDLKKMDFSIKNMLYMLVKYPLHTRIIQLWIHYEAVLIWLKGVPLYPHPHDADVDFGFGISGKKIAAVLYYVTLPIMYLHERMVSSLRR